MGPTANVDGQQLWSPTNVKMEMNSAANAEVGNLVV